MMTIVLGGITVLITHALEAVTGFGCTVLALPFFTALVGVRQGVMVLTILAWILSLYIVLSNWKDIDFRQYAIITALMLCGLPLGIFLFRNADVSSLRTILAVFIVLSASVQLLKLSGVIRITKALPKPLAYALLVTGGIVHGMFSSGGPLVVLYATTAIPDKSRFRATLCLLWTTLNSIIITSYLVGGLLDRPVLIQGAWMLPFLVAGIVVGEKIHYKVNARTFSYIVFSMLLFTGIFMLLFQ
jgi:uncharacterized protein